MAFLKACEGPIGRCEVEVEGGIIDVLAMFAAAIKAIVEESDGTFKEEYLADSIVAMYLYAFKD